MALGHKSFQIMILLNLLVFIHTCEARELGETEVAKESGFKEGTEAQNSNPQLDQQNGQTTQNPNSQPLMFGVPTSSYLITPMLTIPHTSYGIIPPPVSLGQQKAQMVRLSNSQRGLYYQPLRFDVPGSSYLIPPMLEVPGSSYLIPPMLEVPGSSYLIPPMLTVPGSSYFRPPLTASNVQSSSP